MDFAAKNPSEHLLIAVRFYEVADRFKGSGASLMAQDRSLKEQLLDKSASGTTAPSATDKESTRAPAHVVAMVDERTARLQLDVARDSYNAAVKNFKAGVLKDFSAREKEAQQQGDLTKLENIKRERDLYSRTKLRPDGLSKDVLGAMVLAQDVFADAFGDAIVRKTKSGKIEEAKLLQKERDTFWATEPDLVGDVLPLFPNAWYKIRRVNSGKMLTHDKLSVIQSSDSETDDALVWQLTWKGSPESGIFFLKNKQTGKFLSARGVNQGDTVTLIDGAEKAGTEFTAELKGTNYLLIAHHSGLNVTIREDKKTDGADCILWHSPLGWSFIRISAGSN